MLIHNLREIGNRMLAARKRLGLTQAEVAERAELSDRTYADIERGLVNARLSTFLCIFEALEVTPDEILTSEGPKARQREAALPARLAACSARERDTALNLLEVYLDSL